MPIKQSAKKYMGVTQRKRVVNQRVKLAFRTAIKKTLALVKENKFDDAKSAFKDAQKALDKAAKRGVIKANTAARKKSRLVKFLKTKQSK